MSSITFCYIMWYLGCIIFGWFLGEQDKKVRTIACFIGFLLAIVGCGLVSSLKSTELAEKAAIENNAAEYVIENNEKVFKWKKSE